MPPDNEGQEPIQEGDVYVAPGGPGVAPAQEPERVVAQPPPTGRTLNIGGHDYTVADELAQALEDERAASQSGRADDQAELREYRARQARVVEAALPGQARTEDRGVDVLTDPVAYADQLEARIVRNLTAQYNQAEGTRTWWQAFDVEHAELIPYRSFVQQVIQGSGRQFDGLTNEQARTKVGEEAVKQLVQIASKFQPAPAGKRGRTLRMVEAGGSTVPAAAQEPTGTTHADSLGGAMKERRAKKRAS